MNENSNKIFWEKVARFYTRFMKNNDEVYNNVCREMSAYLRADMHVLELACGTGQFTNLLAQNVKTWTATDFSDKMLLYAKGNNKRVNVEYRVADARNLLYEDNSFDAILIANALHIMPEPEKALAEIYRCLKPNGALFAPTFVYDNSVPKFRMWILEKMGFRTFSKWTSKEFSKFVLLRNFKLISNSIIVAKPLSECLLIVRK